MKKIELFKGGTSAGQLTVYMSLKPEFSIMRYDVIFGDGIGGDEFSWEKLVLDHDNEIKLRELADKDIGEFIADFWRDADLGLLKFACFLEANEIDYYCTMTDEDIFGREKRKKGKIRQISCEEVVDYYIEKYKGKTVQQVRAGKKCSPSATDLCR